MTRRLVVGSPAPAFELPAGNGQTVRLSDFRGRKVVVYFYPKDDTPGCTKEACAFRDASDALAEANTVVLGISRDGADAHQRFAAKFRLAFPLLSDPAAATCKAYGVYQRKTLYGRTSWGIARTTYVINEQGRIAAIFPKVRVEGHAEAVLQALRGKRRLVARAGSRARNHAAPQSR